MNADACFNHAIATFVFNLLSRIVLAGLGHKPALVCEREAFATNLRNSHKHTLQRPSHGGQKVYDWQFAPESQTLSILADW